MTVLTLKSFKFIINPLFQLFTYLWNFSETLTCAEVIPFHKKGDKGIWIA